MRKRSILRPLFAGLVGLTLVAGGTTFATAHPPTVRDRIELPAGFAPEGITIGPGGTAYLGSRTNGDIYAADLRSGEGRIISRGPGTAALGLKSDQQSLLYVAGGAAGTARVVSTRTGRTLRTYQLATGNTFVNDVVLTRHFAWFTDSRNQQLYVIPRAWRGHPAPASAKRTIALRGAWVQSPAPTDIDANGIALTPDGRNLLVVNSGSGVLYRVDPRTGRARVVNLGGVSLVNGDGLLVQGRTLYAVQNQLNKIAVVKLNAAGTAGRLVQEITDPDFDIPTTVAAYRTGLYLPNARFSTPITPTTPYWITRVERP